MFNCRIINSQIIYVFERDKDIRKEVFNYEKELGEYFKPFRVNNISDEADSDIVRFQSTSLNGFSKLQVSQNKLILQTEYSEDYEREIIKVKNYLDKKNALFLTLLEKQNLLYMGVVVTLAKDFNQDEILSYIKEKTQTNVIDNEIMDFRYYYSKGYKEKYFTTVQILQVEAIKGTLYQNRVGDVVDSKIEEVKPGIGVVLDFNNKKVMQMEEKFKHEDSVQILNTFFEILEKNNLDNYLTGKLN